MSGLLVLVAFAAILVVLVLTIIVSHDATHPVRRTGAYAAARGLPFDPGDLGFEFDAWALERPAASLAVWEIALTASESIRGARRKDDLTVVLIHGWGESRVNWLRGIEFWRERARRVVLYDLRGHGESTGNSRLGNREDDDLIALLERLGAESPFLLVGRDLGANIAIAAATKNADMRNRIKGVIAIDPYEDFQARMTERLRRRDFPALPMTHLAMLWFTITGRGPLTASRESLMRLGCPALELATWNDAEVAGFVDQLPSRASVGVRPAI